VVVCGSGKTCSDNPPKVCTDTTGCPACFKRAEECLLCPTGLKTVVHANHTKECTVEECPVG